MDETKHIYFSCQEYLEKIGHQELVLLSKIQMVWGEVVGEDIKKNVFPVRITEDALVVAISNPAWDTQVNFFAKDILYKLKKKILENVSPVEVDSKVSNHTKTIDNTFPVKMKTFLKY